MPEVWRFFFVVLTVVLLQACSSASVFKSYPSQAAEYKTAIVTGDIEAVVGKLAKLEKKADGLLYAQERGRLYQLNQQLEESRQSFELVNKLYNEIDDKARVSAGNVAASAVSLATNDNAIPYQGEGFERIFALHSQALNYLALGDMEGASVELRRAANIQRRLELDQERAVDKAEKQAKKEDIDLSNWQQAPELVGLSKAAGKVKSSFLNAYTYYASAVIWEALGETNAALVDYKKAFEINPSNTTIGDDVRRVDQGRVLANSKGHLVIFFEDGFINEKKSFDLHWPYFTKDSITYLSIAFPYYKESQPPQSVSVFQKGESLGQMELIADMDAMAAKALMEKLPIMIVRMVLRARVKYEIHGQSTEQAGFLGSLFSTLYNVLSEQADRRSWLSLPSKVQMLRAEVDIGKQEISLDVNGQRYKLETQTRAGRTTMVRVISVGPRLVIQQFQL